MILLDTHALIFWLTNPGQLGVKGKSQIQKSDRLGLHVMSCFEIAMLAEKGKILLSQELNDWMDRMLRIPKINLIQLTPGQAVRATTLPGSFHRDPVDRILAATCLIEGWPLITKDRQIRDWGMIKTVW